MGVDRAAHTRADAGSRRVAVVVIDAAEWWYLEQQIAAGRMPTLARLRASGTFARLRIPAPYRSETCWTRFLTGRDPIADRDWGGCTTFDPGTYGLATEPASAAAPFFAFGDGTPVVAFDLIHSSLADGVVGPQVTAWGAHSPGYPRASRPAGTLGEIDERFGPHPAFDNDFEIGWFDPDYLDRLGDAVVDGLGRRTAASRWLLERQPDWRLFVTCFSEIHSVAHHYWHGVDGRHPLHGVATSDLAGRRMAEVAATVDRALADLVDHLPEGTTVVVAALHGMQPADDVPATMLLPELLHRRYRGRALLRSPDPATWRRRGFRPVVPAPADDAGTWLAERFVDGPRGLLRALARRTLPPAGYDLLRRAAGGSGPVPRAAKWRDPLPEEAPTPEAIARFRRGADFLVAAWYRRHWPAMPAFALPGFADGRVRLNVAGRERDGVVDPADYRRLRDEVTTLLCECRDARTGRPAVADVVPVVEQPGDPASPDGDLVVLWNGAPDALHHPELGVIGPFPFARTGSHSADGFAVVSGPGVAAADLGTRRADDLSPTVLDLLGRDARACEGRSLLDVRRSAIPA